MEPEFEGKRRASYGKDNKNRQLYKLSEEESSPQLKDSTEQEDMNASVQVFKGSEYNKNGELEIQVKQDHIKAEEEESQHKSLIVWHNQETLMVSQWIPQDDLVNDDIKSINKELKDFG